MHFEKIGVATARIKGLDNSPYNGVTGIFWPIFLTDFSTIGCSFLPLPHFTREEECNKIKEAFCNIGIKDGDKISIMFKQDGNIIAIGAIGKDCWIDLRDNFTTKTFSELNIVITSLYIA